MGAWVGFEPTTAIGVLPEQPAEDNEYDNYDDNRTK